MVFIGNVQAGGQFRRKGGVAKTVGCQVSVGEIGVGVGTVDGGASQQGIEARSLVTARQTGAGPCLCFWYQTVSDVSKG